MKVKTFVVHLREGLVFEKVLNISLQGRELSGEEVGLTGWILSDELAKELVKALRKLLGLELSLREIKAYTVEVFPYEVPTIPYSEYIDSYGLERIYQERWTRKPIEV